MSKRVALAAALVAIFTAAGPVMASTEFRQPEQVSVNKLSEASLAVVNGQPHIAGVGPHGIWYFTRQQGTWTGKRVTYFPGDENSPKHREPAIAVNPVDGSVTIVFARHVPGIGGCETSGLRWTSNRSGDWPKYSQPVGDDDASSTCMVDPDFILQDDHMYIAGEVTTVPVPGAPQRVRYLTDVTGNWTAEELRGTSPASLALDSQGNPHIAAQRFIQVNEDEVAWVVWHARGKSPTGNFVKERIADVPDLTSTASLALSSTNKPRVAWSEPDGIHYAVKTLNGWHEETIVPNLSVTDLVIDPFGFAHMTANGPGGLWYVTGPQNGGAGDFDAMNVTSGGGGDIALSQNNTVQIAFQRGNETWWVRSRP